MREREKKKISFAMYVHTLLETLVTSSNIAFLAP